jgi:hypothetical protein
LGVETEGILVQGPVSRPDSVRHRLAAAAWKVGASAFVANGVPFSFTTGPVQAAGAVDLITFLSEGSEKRAVTVHDVGAGTGYLTRHVVEALADRDPELARLCAYIASDSSSASVVAIDGVLADLPPEVRERISTRTADALLAKDILVEGSSLYLMSYLFDAIPPRHAVRSEEGVNEVVVETWLASGHSVLDASTTPPRVLQDEALAEVLASSPESLSPGAALQVLPLIMEAAIEGPSLPQDPGSQSASFLNTRPEATAALADCVRGMAAESVILVTDFGYSGSLVPDAFDRLMTEYGTTACYAVFFDQLIAAAAGAGAYCCLNAREAGGTHTLAVYKGKRIEAFQDRFDASFAKPHPDRKNSAASQLGPDASRKAVLKAEKQMRAAMDDRDAFSYADLANLAHLLTRFRRYDSARDFAVICDARFGLIAAPEQLLLGDLAAREGDREGASRWFERARSSAPTYGPAHIKAAQVCLASDRPAEYASVMADYVQVTDEAVAAHVEWLGQMEGNDVSFIPDEVEREFEEICTAEFG